MPILGQSRPFANQTIFYHLKYVSGWLLYQFINFSRIPIFSTLIQESGPVVGYFAELVVGIFRDVLSNENIEPELQLKMFIILSKQLFETSDRIDSQKKFGPFALRVLDGELLYKTVMVTSVLS